jgi:hypothetical protein
MRPWIAHLLTNSSAYGDFVVYTKEAVARLNKELTKAVLAEKPEAARGIAHEIKVYNELCESVEKLLREQRSQSAYINNTQGGM